MGYREMYPTGWGREELVADLLLPLLGTLVPLLLLAGIVLLVILLLRRAQLAGPGAGHSTLPVQAMDPALTTLRDRYARGELDTADYEERRRRLLESMEPL